MRTVRAVMGSDCGTVINPDQAAGQLEGGLSKGAGFALLENSAWDDGGQLTCKGFMVDNKVPGVEESPCVGGITTHFAGTYEPSGPFGAKGIGEAATNPVAAAYANAICDATGVRFYELPITPEKILAALLQREAGRRRKVTMMLEKDAGPTMINSHILCGTFDYYEPASVKDASALLLANTPAPGSWPAARTCWYR